jgi:tape measure domain-containing protein
MAGVEVGTAYITVVPSARGFSNKLKSEIGGSLASQGRAAGESYSGGFSSGIGKIGAIISGAFAVSKLGDVAKFGLEVAAQNEQAQISFTTLLKSGSKAKTFIGQLQQFAAKTPFDFPGLQQSASQLLAAGINSKKIIPIMTTLGNVTSGMGTGAEGVQRASAAIQQMNAAQKISAEDLNQLRDAGIPVYDLLSKALDKPKTQIAKLVQGGKLGKDALDKMMKALETGKGLERFSGLMDKQSQSLVGLWSTVKDTFGQGLAKAIGPMIPTIKKILGQVSGIAQRALARLPVLLNGAVTKIRELGHSDTWAAIRAGFVSIGNTARKALPVLVRGIGAVGQVIGFLVKHRAVFAPIAAGVLAVVAAMKVWRAVTIAFTAVQTALNVVLDANPIGLVVLALVGLAAGLVYAYKHSETFRKIVNAAFGAVKKVVVAVVDWFRTGFIPFFTKTIPHAFQVVKDWISSKWKQVTSAVTAPIRKAHDIVAATLGPNGIQKPFRAVQGWVGGTWKKGWSAVSGWVSGAVGKGRDAARSALQKVQDRFGSLKTWTGTTFKRAWANAKGWLSDPVGSARNLINISKGKIQDVFNTLDTWGKRIFGPRWAGIKDKFTAPIRAVVGYFKNIFAKGGTLRKILSDFITGSQIIFSKIKTVMVAPIKGLIGVINTGLIKGAINWLLGKLGVPKNKQVPWIPVPKFAGGGVLPGFTPGRDVHKFYSPTAGGLELSGGEAIMRPEWARAVGGKGAVDRMNDAARRGRMAGGGIYWPTNTHRLSPSYPGHSGVDIAAGQGAPIFATAPGRIAYTGWNHGYGQAIFERFTNGLEAVYGHTSRLLTRAGAMVQAGQRIGLVGATGHATGPHLHFEINSPGPFGNSADRAQSLRYLNGANLTGKGGGGILSSVLGFLHGLDPLQWLANKASGLAGNLGGGMWGAGLAHIPAMLVSKGRGFLSRLFGGGSSGGAGRSAGEAVLRQALAMNGVPATGSNIAAWWRQVLTESGDNPRAMQRISDINSASGNRARGWLQVIPSTFAAYHLPGMNNIFGKLDNAAAAINYWKHAYHGDMGVIGHGHGYANGIRSAAPGWAWTGEHGPELVRFGGGETVLNHQDSMAASGQHVEFNDCQFGADPRQVAVELRRESRRRMAAVNLTTAA